MTTKETFLWKFNPENPDNILKEYELIEGPYSVKIDKYVRLVAKIKHLTCGETKIFVVGDFKHKTNGCTNECCYNQTKQKLLLMFDINNPNNIADKYKLVEEPYRKIDNSGHKRMYAKIKCLKCGITRDVYVSLFIRHNGGCSTTKCRSDRQEETFMKIYGVSRPIKLKEIREKTEKTNIEKYGVPNVFSSETIKQKIKNKMVELYGVEHPLQSEEIMKTKNDTMIKRYGVDNAMYIKELSDKMQNTNIKKYGFITPLQNKIVKDKIKETNIERYGVSNVSQNIEIQRKKSNKNLFYKYKNETYRSSWEVLFQILNPDCEYESITIPYTIENTKHVYIVDFIDIKNKIIYEIKPLTYYFKGRDCLKNRYKAKASVIWAKENGYKFLILSERWYKINKLLIRDFTEEQKEALKPIRKKEVSHSCP